MKARIILFIFAMCLLPINFGCGPMKSLAKGTSKGAFSKVKKYTGKCGKYVFGFLSDRYSDPTNVVGDINTASKNIGKKYLKSKKEVKSYIRKFASAASVASTENIKSEFEAYDPTHTETESAISYFAVARDYEKKDKIDEAIANYEKAIRISTDSKMRAIYNCSIAKLLQKKNNYIDARTYAREAIKQNPSYGVPYIIIATLYASNPVGQDYFEKSMTYWLAIDALLFGKLVDPSIATEAQTLIDRYSTLCPKKEEAFMHSITDGKTVWIGDWINETTQARF